MILLRIIMRVKLAKIMMWVAFVDVLWRFVWDFNCCCEETFQNWQWEEIMKFLKGQKCAFKDLAIFWIFSSQVGALKSSETKLTIF